MPKEEPTFTAYEHTGKPEEKDESGAKDELDETSGEEFEEEQEQESQGDEIPAGMQEAMEQGWRPEEEWEGNPDDWVDYKEFLYRGQLMDRISSESKQRKALQKKLDKFEVAFKKLGEHNKKMLAKQKENLLADLKAERLALLEENDVRGAAELEDRIDDVKAMDTEADDLYDLDTEEEEQGDQQPQYTAEQAEVVKGWVEKNPWFLQDKRMQRTVDGIAEEYQEKHGFDDVEGMLAYVDREIRKEFPHKFNKNKPAMFNKPSGRGKKPAKKAKFTEKDLSPEQLDIARTYEQMGVQSIQEYVNDLAQLGELPSQKGE
jgi:hypothetical protein